jgi:DNA-binding SARP family transcriptional activator
MVTALLLEANRPVPLPRLAAAMWPEPAPRSAVANLRSHVSALRRVLGGRLVARPHAYLLRVEESELDAEQFARLARTGQAALAGGEPAAALVRLGRALALWHGTAGDGLPRGTSLDARLGTLDEQRLDVFEDHVEARLFAGESSGVAADLRRHLANWPVRERSWELLMLALYRAGNASGALSAYAEARAALAGELGIEPGPPLRRLQWAVLDRDPSLDGRPPRASVTVGRDTATVPRPGRVPGPAGAAPRSPVVVPRRLPSQAPALVGRDSERATLTAALRGNPELVVVAGRAGVGKSALAVRTAYSVADRFPDGQVTVELAGGGPGPGGPARAPAEVLAAVRRALGAPAEPLPGSAGELAAAGRSLVAGRRMLLLLDGATDPGQVRPLLPDGPGATLLVTTRRRRLPLDGARHVEVPPLAGRAAVDLLTRYAGAGRTGSEPAAMRELVQRCEGLPLALRIAGEWLARRPGLPARLLAAHLTNQPLDGLRIGDLSVRDALAADLAAVAAEDPLAVRVFPRLGRPAVTSPEELAGELGEDSSRVFFALERLVDWWLVESPRPGRYQAVGLARAYAAELAGG